MDNLFRGLGRGGGGGVGGTRTWLSGGSVGGRNWEGQGDLVRIRLSLLLFSRFSLFLSFRKLVLACPAETRSEINSLVSEKDLPEVVVFVKATEGTG